MQKGWFTHNLLVILLAIAGAFLFYNFMTAFSMQKMAYKSIYSIAFLTFLELYKKFWLSKQNDTDTKIYSDPIATAIYIGALVLGLAFIWGSN